MCGRRAIPFDDTNTTISRSPPLHPSAPFRNGPGRHLRGKEAAGMKTPAACLSLLRRAFIHIHPVDRGLLLFMAVLLTQSAYSLFFHAPASPIADDIDVIVRTASAAIFGYFLSANFVNRVAARPSAAARGQSDLSAASPPDTTAPQNQIGFRASQVPPLQGEIRTTSVPSDSLTLESSCLQVIAATVIGLFCLVALIMLRNISQWDPALLTSDSTTATVAQFRDFVSGCVGFLIGFPTRSGGPSTS